MQIKHEQEIITLLNVYAPTQNDPKDQINLVARLQEQLANLEVQILFMGGDFNIQLHNTNSTTHSSTSRSPLRQSYAQLLRNFMEEYHLADVWHSKNPQSTRGTFHRGNYTATLDYLFIPEFLLSSVTAIDILPEPLSDHSSLQLDFKLTTQKRGPGFWRFNNQLLSNPVFIQEMREHLIEAQQADLSNPNARWEWIKFKARSFAISFAIHRSREERGLELQLHKRLNTLTKDLDSSTSPDVLSEIQSVKRELSEILKHKANKTIFRAKANWAQSGEKPTAYFLGLEKRKSKENTITAVKDEQDRLLTNNTEILDYERRYFQSVYTDDPSQLDPLEDLPISSLDTPKVSDSHRLLANRPFTKEEFTVALKDLNKNKSPGSDGLSPEFLLAFWDVLEDPYFDSIMYSIDINKLSEEQRSGIITLVPKKAKERTILSNWRPITLLNSDFKIYSKALANRIQVCIKDVVEPDQTAFVQGRTIGTNILNIQGVIDQVNADNSTGILLAMDYSKAFDTIRWSLIHKALELFQFGEFLSKAVSVLFKDVKTSIYNHGFSSGYFFPSRGIRQGCCCSPSLFILAVELLAIWIRSAPSVDGISVAGQQVRISQYADDTTLFIRDSASLDALMHIINTFADFSGLRINYQKSYLLLLGNFLHPPSSIHGIKVVEQITILGITFTNRMTEELHYELNYKPKLQRIKEICNAWINRSLSMKGKVVLITSLLISILQYPCSCTSTPKRVYDEFKKISTDFIWNSRRSKIAYALLIQDIPEGGIKLPDLETRVKTVHLYWIRYLWHNPDSVLSRSLRHHLGLRDNLSLIMSKTHFASALHERCTFLKQILATWASCHIFNPTTELDLQKELLWHNSNIQIAGSPCCWKRWESAGIRHINDLLHPSEPRFFSHEEINQTYGTNASFLQLLQIRTAIPFSWRSKLLSHATQDLRVCPTMEATDNQQLDLIKTTSKKIYASLVRRKKPQVSSQNKWNTLFPVDEDSSHDYWAAIYKRPYRSARETKLQAFQFRIIHRILPCNKFLNNLRILPADSCTFCH